MQKEKITAYFESGEYIPMNKNELAVMLSVPKEDMETFSTVVDEIISEGTCIVGKKGRIFPASKLGLVKGIFRAATKGFGFVTREEGDIHISEYDCGGALNGDTVLVRIKKSHRSRGNAKRKDEGSVVQIIKRAEQIIVGIFSQERGYGIVTPDNEKLPEIFVSQHDINGALNGQKVVCEIVSYETQTTSLCARIKEILGFPYDFGVDMLSVIKSYGFATEFPEKALKDAEMCNEAEKSDLDGREDFTAETVITIDGDDTKDIDDAISVKKTENGYILGVHIADVSHYVKCRSFLDKEAFSRGTSVYLADRVIPMLPVKLSNGLCSLNEGVLRLTMSAVMEFDEDGNMTDSRFCKSYIKSKARMTYENVRLILSEQPKELMERYKDITESLTIMYELAKKLNKKTKERGAFDFNFPEAKAVFDKNGKTVDIVLRRTSFANNIIEEFMIAANSAVANFLEKEGFGAVYRVHENPNEEKLANIAKFMYNMGHGRVKSIYEMLEAVKGKNEELAVSTMILRSMAKAKYYSKNLGHFGLALNDYCHFTSPIRRYPDLVCHRALKAAIEGSADKSRVPEGSVEEACEHLSEREAAAAMCERDTLDIKKAEYMMQFIGEEFEGIISSVTGFGFFVMLPNTVEGLVRVETLKDDYYNFDENMLTLTGERTNRVFALGTSVKVKLLGACKSPSRIDFQLLEGGNIYAGKRKKKNDSSKQNRPPRVLHRRKKRGRH